MRSMNTIAYLATLLLFLLVAYFILQLGKTLEPSTILSLNPNQDGLLPEILKKVKHPIALLFLQILIVAAFARILGYVFSRKLKQPNVMGEIVAGIMLGPSLLGYYFPEMMNEIFPPSSLGNLSTFSQVGLILFMFIIGMELDLKVLKSKVHSAILISHASIIFPFGLGMALSYFIYQEFAPQNISFLSFSLFIGISMSITAFPVLARILQERNLTRTPLGAMVLTCAAADDITAWILLAIIVTIAKAGSLGIALFTIGLSIVYILTMIFVVAPFLARLGTIYISRENLTKTAVAMILLILLGSSFTTEVIGIHALFGAFLAGVVMPSEGNLKKLVAEKIEDVAVILFLPVFFVITGLRTQITLLNDGHLWYTLGLVVLIAVIGKFFGSAIAARYSGASWEESLSIGALMNTRGLMELVVLNIGYELGILGPEIFSIFVLMALITTLSTGPVLDLIQNVFTRNTLSSPQKTENKLGIVVAFAQDRMGKVLVRLAYALSGNQKKSLNLTALHISPNDTLSSDELQKYKETSFESITDTAKEIGLNVRLEYRITDNITYEIVNFTKQIDSQILLIGAAKPLFSRSYTGGRIKSILSYSTATVGVLIDQGLENYDRVAIIYNDPSDEILRFSEKIRSLKGLKSTQIRMSDLIQPETDLNPDTISIAKLRPFSLVIIDIRLWEENEFEKLDLLPTSFLLVRFLHT